MLELPACKGALCSTTYAGGHQLDLAYSLGFHWRAATLPQVATRDGADSAMTHAQMTTTYPNVTASISLTGYTLETFGSDQQAQFGQRILGLVNASSTEVNFTFTNIRAGSVLFDFEAIFVNGNTTQAQILGTTMLVRGLPTDASTSLHEPCRPVQPQPTFRLEKRTY